MNIEIRSGVLEKSLKLEDSLSKIVGHIIRIPKAETKTLGNQSSSLSFKTKVDLLYDLGRITKDDYNLLILFMEIRNQFVHNVNAESFTVVLEIIPKDKKAKLLKVNPDVEKFHKQLMSCENTENEQEENLVFAFQFLYLKLEQIIKEQYEKLIEDFEKEKKLEFDIEYHSKMNDFLLGSFEIFQETVEEFGEIWATHLEQRTGNKSQFKEQMSAYIHQKAIEKTKIKFPEFNPDR